MSIPTVTTLLEKVSTARDVQQQIERVIATAAPIGYCDGYEKIEKEYGEIDYDGDGNPYPYAEDEEDEEETILTQARLDEIVHQYLSPRVMAAGDEFNSDDHIIINLPGKEIAFHTLYDDVSTKEVKEIYEVASIAGFGNVKTLTTDINPMVRNSREITSSQFTISKAMLREVERRWAENLYPRKVRAEAYKINIYQPGDFFSAHRDTPEKDLLGTFLLRLHDTSDTKFILKGKDVDYVWCAFFTDVVHEMPKLNEGYRMYVSFKIYSSVEEKSEEKSKESSCTTTDDKLKNIFSAFETPFGVLLSHYYTKELPSSLKDIDEKLYQITSSLPDNDVSLVPVVIDINYQWTCYDSRKTYSTDVYSLLDTAPAKKPSKKRKNVITKEVENVDGINFLLLDGDNNENIRWKAHENDAIEHTGNESRPGDGNSIYISCALIVTKKITYDKGEDKDEEEKEKCTEEENEDEE
jgi:hypothetical protein